MSDKKKNKKQLTRSVKPQSGSQFFYFLKDKKVLTCLAITLIITFIAYYPSLNNKFTNWDDDHYILGNISIRGFSSENIKEIFSSYVSGNYHPITILTFSVEYLFFELNPKIYHLDNVILHLINTALVFILIHIFSKRLEISLITALLFGVHPFNVESVAWVSERKNVLFGLFYFLAIISYILYIRGGNQKKHLLFTLLLFLLSVLSKATAVTLPVLLLLFDHYYKRPFNKALLLEKLPFFIISLIFGLVSISGVKAAGAVAEAGVVPLTDRIFLSSYATIIYLLKTLIPYNLCSIHPHPDRIGNALPLICYISPLFVIAIAWATIKSLKFNREVLFGVLFFLINIGLFLQLLPVGPAIVAERYAYVPFVGLFYLIGWGLNKLIKKDENNSKRLNYQVMIFLLMAVSSYSIITWDRCKVWENSGALWSDVIAKYPNVVHSYCNRGDFLRANKEYDKSINDFNTCIKLDSTYSKAFNNLGIVHYELGRLDLALENFSKVIQLNPQEYAAYNNRGAVYLNTGKPDLALSEFNKALSINKNYADAFFNRSLVYQAKKDFTSAKADALKARTLGYYVQDAYLELLRKGL